MSEVQPGGQQESEQAESTDAPRPKGSEETPDYPSGEKRRRGPMPRDELQRAIESERGKSHIKELLATRSGREKFGLNDLDIEPDPAIIKANAEVVEKATESKHSRWKEWAAFGLAVALHVAMFLFLAFYVAHNSQRSQDAKLLPDERKLAEANIEKAMTGFFTYVMGTVGGYAFKPK